MKKSKEEVEKKGNPFRGLFITENPQELLEIAFKKTKKLSPPTAGVKSAFLMKKNITLFRLEHFCRFLSDRLKSIVKSYPSIDTMHEFYKSTLQIYASIDEVKKSLAKVQSSSQLILNLFRTYRNRIREIEPTSNEKEEIRRAYRVLERTKKEAYGRITSVVKKLKKDLELLTYTVKMLKRLPDIDPQLPTVLVVGPPNSGKSSLVKVLSTAKVEIASYPFTTKNITLGHMELDLDGIRKIVVQIADTPGIFDRPLEERKKEELLAITALETIADLVIFLFDISEQSTLNPQEQLSVLDDVLKVFKNRDTIYPVGNKADILHEETLREIKEGLVKRGFLKNKFLAISVVNNHRIDEVKNIIRDGLKKRKKNL